MWWNSLDIGQQIYFIIGCVAAGLMLAQTIVALVAGHGDTDIDVDGDGDVDVGDGGALEAAGGLRVFTIRGVLAFILFFAWASFAFSSLIGHIWSAIIGFLLGVGAMFLAAFIVKLILKLRYDGTLNVHNAVGKIGEVYIPIGASRSSIGKINVEFQGKITELSAVTDDPDGLKTGMSIKVVQMLNESTFIVEKA